MTSPMGDTYGAFSSDCEAVKQTYLDTNECLESLVTGLYSESSTYSKLIALPSFSASL